MRVLIVGIAALLVVCAPTANADPVPCVEVPIYVDAAPNVYGSPAYDPWETAAFAAAADGTFVNMASGANPSNVGTTDFMIEDEVVYSFGDLGKRLTWVYWIENETVLDLTGRIEVKLENWWDGAYQDFYLDYYGSTWLVPSKIYDYDADGDGQTDGVLGLAGMAWWGGYNTNTQAELDADLAAWGSVSETWVFTVKLDGCESSLESNRAPVPEPATLALLGLGFAGLVSVRRKRNAA